MSSELFFLLSQQSLYDLLAFCVNTFRILSHIKFSVTIQNLAADHGHADIGLATAVNQILGDVVNGLHIGLVQIDHNKICIFSLCKNICAV